MEEEVKKYKKYKSQLKFLLAASGLWPDYEDHPVMLRRFLSLCSAFTSGFSFYCILVFFIRYSTNIQVFTSCLGLMIAFFSTFMKVCILFSHEKSLQGLNNGISARFEENLKIPDRQAQLLRYFPVFAKMLSLMCYTVGFAAILLILMPLILLFRQNKYVTAYPQVLPFNYEPGGIIHWTVYAFEICSGFFLWSVTCSVDCAFGLYVLHIVGELRLLSIRFRSLRPSKNYQADFKSCILNHYFIIDSQHRLEQVFSFLTIWLTVTCAISVCGLVFQATQLEHFSTVRILYLSSHIFVKFTQAYCYSWYGNILAVESTSCLNSIYNAKWSDSGNTRFMSDVLIVLLQKPKIFRVMGFMDLRLDTFLTILNTSVSYFFLLRTLAAKHP